MAAPGRIGFVDYQLNNFHADTYLKLLRGDLADLGFVVTGCTALDVEPSQKWARANDVPWFDTVAALDEHVDFYVVLAPSNPELHLPLCESVFPAGKATYVDKTFAPDLATAQAIFDLAATHGVTMQTTSALRYTDVQKYVTDAGGSDNILHMVTWGGGSSFDEYAIHPVEMVVSCMGPDVRRLRRWSPEPRSNPEPRSKLLLEWADGRTALIHVHTDGGTTPYAASLTTATQTRFISVDTSTIFRDTARAFLTCFARNQANVAQAQTLAVHSIIDAARRPEAQQDFVVL